MQKDLGNRTRATTKNMFWGIVSKVVSLILSFGSRTIFIHYLGKEMLGVNSLYTEVLSMLSLAELGFGTAFTFSMYKPIADRDDERIRQLLGLFKFVYHIIAVVVLALGLILTPFLQYIVKGADSLNIQQLRLYFVLFLLNTVINYLVQYKTTFVNACMQSYVVSNIEMATNTAVLVSQCIIIIVFKNYFLYLLINTVMLIFSRFAIALYLNVKYPILNQKPKKNLPKSERKKIYKDVKGLALQNFAGVAIHSTDNLIISMVSGLGVIGVGLVSNYNTLITSVTGFITIVLGTLTPGFGNLVASSSQQRYKECFDEVNFYDFWIYGFCSIAFFVLIPPFIVLWIGEEYLIDTIPFLLIVMNVYLLGQSVIYNNARIAKGNYNLDKWISVAQALINLVVSIVAAKILGLTGVYIGTIASRLFYVVARPAKTYRFLYGCSVLEYYKNFIMFLLATIFAGSVTYLMSLRVFADGISVFTFIIACIIVAIIPNLTFLLLFYKTQYIKLFVKRLSSIVRRKNG